MVDITRYLPKGFIPDADFIERFIWHPDEGRIIENCRLISKAIMEDRENRKRENMR